MQRAAVHLVVHLPVSFSINVVKLILHAPQAALEFHEALAERAADLGQARAEDQQAHEEDDQDLEGAQGAD